MPNNKTANTANAKKIRKAYPAREVRVQMADAKIKRLEALNANRAALIEKTEKTLAERKEAFRKTETSLAKARALRDRLLENPEASASKKQAARGAKNAEKAKLAELAKMLQAKGKSIDEVLEELKA